MMKIIKIISTLSICILFNTNVFSQLDWTINDSYDISGSTLRSLGGSGSKIIISRQSIPFQQNGWVEISNVGTATRDSSGASVYVPEIDNLSVLLADRCNVEQYGFKIRKVFEVSPGAGRDDSYYGIFLINTRSNDHIRLDVPLTASTTFKLEKTGAILLLKINGVTYGDGISVDGASDLHLRISTNQTNATLSYSVSGFVSTNSIPSDFATGYSNLDENFIRKTIYPYPTTTSSPSSCTAFNIESIVYYDGLGRPKQNIEIIAGGQKEDIITPVLYDQAGRNKRGYLPYADISLGSGMHPNALQTQEAFYDTLKYENTTNAYSENKYTSSISSTIEETGAPGEDWKVQENTESIYDDRYASFPFNINGHESVDYKTSQIINDYLFLDAKFESSVGFTLTSTLYSRDLFDLYGVTAADNVELGYVKNEAFEDTPFRLKIIGNQLIFENTGAPNYTSKVYRFHYSIPLSNNRILSLHTIKNNVSTNIENEVINYNVSYSGTIPQLVEVGYYEKEVLSKSVLRDENWSETQTFINDNTIVEYKNKTGQVLLKRTFDRNIEHNTYYVYNDFGNLTYVIPPKVNTSDGVSTSELNNLCYQYKFDKRKRLVEKKIPGKGWEYIVYNALDKPILTQDAIQRANNEWLFTKYDAFGRVVYTGVKNVNRSREAFQVFASNTTYNQYEQRVENPSTVGGKQFYYSKNAIPTIMNKILTINYYDNYGSESTIMPFNLTGGSERWNYMSVSANVKGLSTISQTRILDTNDWITTVKYYDEKGRPRKTYFKNDYLNVEEWNLSELDFMGNTLQSEITHIKDGNRINSKDLFTYDHRKRLLTQKQQLNDQTQEIIVKLHYDELGQLYKKDTGGESIIDGYNNSVGVVYDRSNGTITKTGTYGWGWNSGISTKGMFKNDGYVEWKMLQQNKNIMVGLSTEDTNQSYSQLAYAIYTTSSGSIYLREDTDGDGSNENIGYFGTYNINDVLRIERLGDNIHYIKNGNIIHTSTMPAYVGTLIGDTSFASLEASIKDFRVVSGNTNPIQTIDYTYNIRGWLKAINDVDNLGDDLFSFKINYNNQEGLIQFEDLYNGNISQTIWKTASADPTNTKRGYSYQYDALNRIKQGVMRKGENLDVYTRHHLRSTTYDKNGNILSLSRDSKTTIMDNLTYAYNGNQLISVEDAIVSYTGEGFKDGANLPTEYTYDANGNMLRDYNKNIISDITYNFLNLPEEIKFNNSDDDKISYVYSANGAKLRKIAKIDALPTTTDYAGNYIYENGTLQFFNHPEGYIESDGVGGFEYVYQYKDHLGNIRLSYLDANGNGSIDPSTEIIEENNYYPFGLEHKGYNNVINGTHHPYGFGGKEEQDELGLNWIDITARNYDPALGRWMNIDPLAENGRRHSPYNYAFDNPIFFIDYDGMWPFPTGGPFFPGLTTAIAKLVGKVNTYMRNRKTLVSIGNAKSSIVGQQTETVPGSGITIKGDGVSNSDTGPTVGKNADKNIEIDRSIIGSMTIGGNKKINRGNGKTNATTQNKNSASNANNKIETGQKVTNGIGIGGNVVSSIRNTNDASNEVSTINARTIKMVDNVSIDADGNRTTSRDSIVGSTEVTGTPVERNIKTDSIIQDNQKRRNREFFWNIE